MLMMNSAATVVAFRDVIRIPFGLGSTQVSMTLYHKRSQSIQHQRRAVCLLPVFDQALPLNHSDIGQAGGFHLSRDWTINGLQYFTMAAPLNALQMKPSDACNFHVLYSYRADGFVMNSPRSNLRSILQDEFLQFYRCELRGMRPQEIKFDVLLFIQGVAECFDGVRSGWIPTRDAIG
jgi:hypothetical protein